MPNRVTVNSRTPEAYIEPVFLQRWSPRAFRALPIPAEVLKAIFEAARWAPSAYNEQPWLFAYATTIADREKTLAILVPANQVWAKHAPVLGLVACRKAFSVVEGANRTAAFDAGQACMAMQLQAIRYGIHVHMMSGFDVAKAHAIYGLDPKEYEIIAAFAMGVKGDADTLPEAYQKMEAPSERRPLKHTVKEGGFPAWPPPAEPQK